MHFIPIPLAENFAVLEEGGRKASKSCLCVFVDKILIIAVFLL